MKTRNINDFISVTRSGLYCAAGDFYLDPSLPVHKAVVTHAHADHATRNSGHIYCSPVTRMLMLARNRNKMLSQFHEAAYRAPFQLNDVVVQFLPAGHMLGSCQILMEYRGMRTLYTGDFKIQEDDSAEPFETVEADVLITETTFANPDYTHPDPSTEIRRIREIGQPLLIGAYVMGKAQRITRLLSAHCSDRPLFVHPEVRRYHEVYEAAGRELGQWKPYRRKEFFDADRPVCILPPGELARYSRKDNVYRMFATGWKKTGLRCDSILQISDHADWNDLLNMIARVKPRQVYTLHGDGRYLRDHLSGSGTEVFLLESH